MRRNLDLGPDPRSGLALSSGASRRRVVGVLAAGGLGSLAALGKKTWQNVPDGAAASLAQGDATPRANPDADDAVGHATAPAWTITVAVVHDPYPGEIQAPENPPAGVRFVATELVIDNASDQALAFTPADVRLVDATGVEYRGGAAAGTEPFLGVRNLNGGDRSRGWVWFMVPEAAALAEVIYVAPTPLFRIALG